MLMEARLPLSPTERAALTSSCRDCDALEKVPGAGGIVERGAERLQVMHDGSLLLAGAYHGDWMEEIIRNLHGHHEPQEEFLFHQVLALVRPGSLMIELGAFWAFYTNWFLGAVPNGQAICVEPDASHLEIGRRNLEINGRSAEMYRAFAGSSGEDTGLFRQESDGEVVEVPRWNLATNLALAGDRPVEILHVDVQGAEVELAQDLSGIPLSQRPRFVFLATHHESITGDARTHERCLEALVRAGALILWEHTVDESFSGDGQIVAALHPSDHHLTITPPSRACPAATLFGPDPAPTEQEPSPALHDPLGRSLSDAETVSVSFGKMWVARGDQVIGDLLRNGGAFDEGAIAEVTAFLREVHGFQPVQFVDIGANIGTHLLFALRSGLFREGVGFEADPFNVRLLTENARENDLSPRVFHLALTDRHGLADLHVHGTNFGDHRLHLERPPGGASEHIARIQVPAETLDRAAARFGIPFDRQTLVWMDTQGHEGHIFRGGNSALGGEESPYVVFEFWPGPLQSSGGLASVLDFLRGCECIYDIREPDWQRSGLRTCSQIEDLAEEWIATTGTGLCRFTDLLCIRPA